MSAAMIAQLLVTFGPQAVELIEKLVALWGKPELTPEEVREITSLADKSYADYIAEARAAVKR